MHLALAVSPGFPPVARLGRGQCLVPYFAPSPPVPPVAVNNARHCRP